MPDLFYRTGFATPTGTTAPLRMLIVEDDPSYAVLLKRMIQLSTNGTATVEHVDRLSGILPRLEKVQVDAMVLDLVLPDGNGLDWLRANGPGLHVPVIVLTGHEAESVAVESLAAGAQDFLGKSHLQADHLMRAVRYALERKRSDETLRQREEQLRQAQKMEAVGRLAGGIAHDFSNLLTVIIGASEHILDVLGTESPLRHEAESIRGNCERAAGLTRQLLAFSRRQVLEPIPVDLRKLVASIGTLLTQLIGEHIFLVIDAKPDLWPVNADPAQVEQVMMNLALNARDAMPGGGSLTLRLQNKTVTTGVVHDGVQVPPGDYVVLDVADTGHGMDAETKEHAFEPFFTTKDVAKGTGLGLATVYGIVKQSNGFVWIDSAPDRGTTVRVYLPRTRSIPQAQIAVEPLTDVELRGKETVLLTEDEGGVRELVQDVLETHGYTVIAASGLPDALALVADRPATIDVLVSDIVMPGGTGQELAARLKALRPRLKVLFMSGYPERHGSSLVLDADTAFLPKPFTRKMLLRKLRELLTTD